MITLRANISETEWRAEFPKPIELPAGMSEAEWRNVAAPHVGQVVTIQHPGFPNGLWQLRFPEKIANGAETTNRSIVYPYQTGMQWLETTAGWSFKDCPIAGLDGTVQGLINASDNTVSFSLTMTNQSTEAWPQTLAWLCFNHARSRQYYQYRNFVFGDGEMVQTPPDPMEHYCLQGHQRSWWDQGDLEPTESLITTSCLDEAGQAFSVGIGASQAIMLGQNPNWPCTDMALLFGDISPGQRATVEGRIYFTYGSPLEILRLYQQDFG